MIFWLYEEHKNHLLIISLTITYLLTGDCYAQLNDNFSDGDFIINPAWTGDNPKFAINGGKLKLQAPAVSESAFLSTPSEAIYLASWEFYIQMDFTPSSTNQAKVYLVSDRPNLNGPLNGYFVKIGNTAREIALYRQSGNAETKIIDGFDDRINLSLVKAKVRVTRSESGVWQLFSDVGPSGTYASEGTFTDKIFDTSAYFGIHCTYTATRSDKFWFDDFVVTGIPVPDTSPPAVQSVITKTDKQVSLLFSEAIASPSQSAANFLLENIGLPASTELSPDQRTIVLNFSKALVNGVTYKLKISNVKDAAGNVLEVSVNCLFFQPVDSHNKDIIFTEIFPDGAPQIGLPNAEFVEIYNRTSDPFNVAGWKLTDGSSGWYFSVADHFAGRILDCYVNLFRQSLFRIW
ncbi:MAG: Ig-like domain-containing protein [Bacteroidota bacterium]